MFIVFAERRHIFHTGTRTVAKHFPAILVNLLEELAQINAHRTNGYAGTAINTAPDHVIETHKLKHLSVGFIFADAHPLRLALFGKASRAVTGWDRPADRRYNVYIFPFLW